MPDGNIAYTRDGTFHLNSDGQVVTANGFPLEPAVVLPAETQTFTVGEDGTVSVTVPGSAQPQIIGNLQTADFINPGACRPAEITCSWKPPRAARPRSARPV